MAHRRSFRQSAQRAPRRKRLWADLNVQTLGEDMSITRLVPPTLVAAGASLQISAFASSSAPALLESTLVRLRGFVDIPKILTSATGLTDTVFAFGIGFVSEEAAAQVAVPNPATGSGLDWDGWMFLRSSTQVPLDITGTQMDVKAMRKWESGTSLIFVAGMSTSNAAGDSGMNFQFSARGLFLLA